MEREQIAIDSEFIKLDSFLKFAGLAPDRRSGQGRHSGRRCAGKRRSLHHAGQKLRPGDIVTTPDIPDLEFEVIARADQ